MNRRWKMTLGLASLLAIAVGSYGRSPAAEKEGMGKMTSAVRRKFPGVAQLQAAELADWLSDKSKPQPQILDVREPDEFAVSHLHGAINVRPDAPASEVLARLDPARPVVVYCSVGYRSSKLAQRLMDAGFKNVRNLEGSLFNWANEGRPLEKEGHTTQAVHPYNRFFGRLLKPGHRIH